MIAAWIPVVWFAVVSILRKSQPQAEHTFIRQDLTLTQQLLRAQYPDLSRAITSALTPNSPKTAHIQYSAIEIEALTIGKIVAALTQIGQKALNRRFTQQDKNSDELIILRTLIRAWINLAEWLILQSEPAPCPEGCSTYYH